MNLDRYTRRALTISTAHVSSSTARDLDIACALKEGDLWDTLPMEPWGEYGWIVCVGDDLDLDSHPDLDAVLVFARNNGFEYVWFDCDAPTLDPHFGLPIYDWS